jgi:hypothetical protein
MKNPIEIITGIALVAVTVISIGVAGLATSSATALARDNDPAPFKTCTFNGGMYLPGEVVKIDDGFDERAFLCTSSGEWVEVTYLDSAEKVVNSSRRN